MSGATSGASLTGSRMPHCPAVSGSPTFQARMISGLPRPAIAGSASCAPCSASLRMSGSGLISLFIGMKPATIVPGAMGRGNARCAMVSAAACRSAAGSTSRLASVAVRRRCFLPERFTFFY